MKKLYFRQYLVNYIKFNIVFFIATTLGLDLKIWAVLAIAGVITSKTNTDRDLDTIRKTIEVSELTEQMMKVVQQERVLQQLPVEKVQEICELYLTQYTIEKNKLKRHGNGTLIQAKTWDNKIIIKITAFNETTEIVIQARPRSWFAAIGNGYNYRTVKELKKLIENE
ncbi:hypothetical protein Amet_1050 [Alkaliphilus metalliredigens QYMF]|uniref:DUF1499 domain-containing protein n=1 Tax=Alkaliphilus metalliredigens (strain QYMF) TaxID=293826 RepID=A6TM47_ALKMQ|nr:hypothetical protein [Alkaliphilus metalliredigens]ABR47265.1 hypothetical protein Amet_1050 [Alkaliphilus metalliredigens QYMF]